MTNVIPSELNNIWLYDYLPFCDASIIFSDTICRTRRGEFFYENISASYQKKKDIGAAGGASTETDVVGSELGIQSLISTSLIGTDTLQFDGHHLADFPLGIPRSNWDHGYTILHAMGMGPNSTFLNKLVETGQTASRVWSIFWGRMWVDNPLDGSVVIGGYDEEKVIGQNYTQPLDYNNNTGCWTGMKVSITGIDLVDRTGNVTSILPPSLTVDACIVPQRQLLLEAPVAIRDTFENVTATRNIGQSFGLHWSAALYDAKTAYTGDLRLSFSSGLEVTVPNDQFMVPFVTIERNGSRIFNESQREFLMNGLLDQPPTLGRYFLTAAYLMVDHDASTFTLWQANPTAASQLVPVLSGQASSDAETCNLNSTSTTGTPGQVEPTTTGISGAAGGPQSLPQPSKRLSGGIIAAIAIAAVVTIASLTLLGLYVRRRKGKQHVQLAEAQSLAIIPDKDRTLFRQTRLYEMHSDSRPYEVQGSAHMVYELDARSAR
jgi:hypothetical protein